MQRLMRRCVEEARTQGYHLSWLGGQRQRYAYFGYERCGTAIQFNLNKSNIAHTTGTLSHIHFEAIAQHQGDRLQRAFALHAAQAVHTQRPEAELYAHLTCWNSQPHAALVGNEMVGYLIVRPGGAIGELLATGTPEDIQNDRRVIDAYLGAH